PFLLASLLSYCPHRDLPSFPTRRSSDLLHDRKRGVRYQWRRKGDRFSITSLPRCVLLYEQTYQRYQTIFCENYPLQRLLDRVLDRREQRHVRLYRPEKEISRYNAVKSNRVRFR